MLHLFGHPAMTCVPSMYSLGQNIIDILTNYTNGLPYEPQSTAEAHVFGPTSGRPQSHQVLDTEKHNQTDLHPEQCFVRKPTVILDGRQDAEYQAH